ncbi:MAG: PIN domain-containing protein [Rhodobacteraceae bacterium]|uniref:RSP_2648 family PIN domain-containing protein n=1 Tax=Thioclava sp. L04-15 TaxID=1915318 RepID=UPI000997499C|nr:MULTISPECIES: PIN domain-containing protein [unclassified Thioclava]MBD3802838.1 PIN domain-containing protein [Thioclava sp.]OOY27092.1 PIN domain-containing protein [Thioclava sp. L04-15]TNE87531.1 MAG: PIN domain-containing protein [Paracoccaceae bacterium]TNF15291.1 MAG: PIN domain-containing protein [Paracoccaceae bacterium]
MQKILLDACVLYPTVLREILIGAAKAGLYHPLWSARILEEWARAAARRAPADEAIARGEIALLRASFPKAEIAPQPGIEQRLVLPDDNDIHVLAAAIAGSADAIVTFNAQDFPRGTLAGEGLDRRDPDGFLWQLLSEHPEEMRQVTEVVRAEAERLSGEPQPIRALMKRARLPRFGKALAG